LPHRFLQWLALLERWFPWKHIDTPRHEVVRL
jgi:hypothetical protein